MQAWTEYLTVDLGYPAAQVTSDGDFLACVFRDDSHKECLALVSPREPKPARQRTSLEARARQLRAEFVAIGSPSTYDLFQVGPYALTPAPLKTVPAWTPGLRRRGLIGKEFVLLPFREEADLRRAFGACHDALFLESAKDPAAAFDLMSLVIVAKVLDEQNEGTAYQFVQIADESDSEMVARFMSILRAAREWLAGDDLSEEDIRPVPLLKPQVVATVLRELQDYSLTLTSDSPSGTDLLGVAYEHLVGATFRGELGSYFTPRNIANFMVRLLDIRRGRVLDPSCGSGGLLVAAHRFSSSEHAGNALELFGNDLNPRMVEAARANLLVHGHDPKRILHGDGLELERMLGSWFKSGTTSDEAWWDREPGPFDYVLANPPFAGHERSDKNLRFIATAQRADGTVRSLNRTLPFLEVIVASLREGGMAGLVIPTSILNAEEESFVRFRSLLLQHSEVLAIIGLPEKGFVHTDCGVHGALLFLKRTKKPRKNYNVFVAWADNLGYDRLGKPTKHTDFPGIIDRYRSKTWNRLEKVSVNDLVRHGRWDPAWLRVAQTLPTRDAGEHVALSTLVEIRDARWSRTQLREDQEYRYFEVADADVTTGEVMTVHTATGFELAKKGRIKVQVRAGDVLLPNHRDSLLAGKAKNGRSVVIVGKDLDGVLTTDRFMVLRPRIEPAVLAAVLNSRGVRRQMIAQSRGAASLDIREHSLERVLVPKLLLDSALQARIKKAFAQVQKLRHTLDSAELALSEIVESAFERA